MKKKFWVFFGCAAVVLYFSAVAQANVLDDWQSINYTYDQTLDRTEDAIIRQREFTLSRTQSSEIIRGQDLKRVVEDSNARAQDRLRTQQSMLQTLRESFRTRISKGVESIKASKERILAVARVREQNRLNQEIAKDLVERNKYQQKVAQQMQENQLAVQRERIRDRMQKTRDMIQSQR